ncbi:hypothetical protein TNCV_948111 [Trichonephila clavipes]|nr:hypothetical protein TNCV_948111 [Trichonephila clavipes]
MVKARKVSEKKPSYRQTFHLQSGINLQKYVLFWTFANSSCINVKSVNLSPKSRQKKKMKEKRKKDSEVVYLFDVYRNFQVINEIEEFYISRFLNLNQNVCDNSSLQAMYI